MSKNYYDILGVDKNSTPNDIKKAYRKLSKNHHPDVGGEEEKFKEISEAYSILSDETKRSNYDNYGDPNGPQIGGFGGGNPFGGFGGGFNMDDIFSQFGFGGQQQKVKRGYDIKLKVTIDITDVNTGLDKKLKYKREVKCKSCNGWGGEHDNCTHCNGTGRINIQRQTAFGNILSQSECPHCKGDGYVITKPCNTCKGSGLTSEDSELNVSIPKGINNGDKFQANGKGNSPLRPGNGGIYGDLLIFIEIVNNTKLERDGNNLIYHINLSFTKLMLGGDIIVPSLEGNVKIKINPYSKPNDIKKLKNKGLSDQRGYKGDLLVILNLDIPNKLSEKEKELLTKLSELDNFK